MACSVGARQVSHSASVDRHGDGPGVGTVARLGDEVGNCLHPRTAVVATAIGELEEHVLVGRVPHDADLGGARQGYGGRGLQNGKARGSVTRRCRSASSFAPATTTTCARFI